MKEKIRETRSIWNTMNVDIVYVEVKLPVCKNSPKNER